MGSRWWQCSCGTVIDRRDRVTCPFCGTHVRNAKPQPEQHRYCTGCGQKVDPGHTFCKDCRTRLEDVQPDPPETGKDSPPQSFEEFEKQHTARAVRASRKLDGIYLGCATIVGVIVLFLVLAIVGGICNTLFDIGEDEPTAPTRPAPPAQSSELVCDRDAEAAYMVDLQSFMQDYGSGSSEVERQMGRLEVNASLVLNTDWRDGVMRPMTEMVDASEGIMDLRAPGALAEIETAANRLARDTQEVVSLYESAFEDMDVENYDLGGQKFRAANRRVGDMVGLMAN